MCNFASFVITKGREFWSDKSDSHTTIIEEHGLNEDGVRGPNIVRVEISPTDKITKWPSLKDWAYKVDQDWTPDWHEPVTTEKRARAALERRFKAGFKTVYASGCTALTELNAPEAATVDAYGCAALTELNAPKANYVYASRCAALTELNAPKATTVYASRCTALTELNAPKATTVYAYGCAALTELNAPKATTVDASGCAALTELNAPKATTVRASGCAPSLKIKAARGARIVR